MEELTLVSPSPAYAEAIAAYRKSFLETGDSMDGTSGLRRYESVQDWLDWLAVMSTEAAYDHNFVPDSQFLVIRTGDQALVGMVDIRHELNDYLLAYGGHIGYSVHPAERRKGCAKELLRLCLIQCRAMGLERVLITCSKENEASRRTILSAGGILENEVRDESTGEVTQRYWINQTKRSRPS